MDAGRETSPLAMFVGILGMLLYIPVGFFYFGSGLVTPMWFAVMMWIVWVAGLWVLTRVFKRTPMRTWIVPVGAMVLWATVVTLGDWLFGWNA